MPIVILHTGTSWIHQWPSDQHECYASVITYISSARMPTSFSLTVKYADSRVRTVVKILKSAAIGKLKNNPLIDWPTCTRRYSKIPENFH